MLSSSLTSIPHHAFIGCEHLDTISIPDNVVSIDGYAFVGTSLEMISLPNALTHMGMGHS